MADDAREAVGRLIATYAERLDAGDLEGVAELFRHAVYRSAGGGAYRGRDAVRDVLRRAVVLHEDGTPRTKHVTTNLVVDVDEAAGTAVARSYFVVYQATADLPLQAIVAGRYHDRFARVDGVWRFADRLIHLDLVGEVRHHLRR